MSAIKNPTKILKTYEAGDALVIFIKHYGFPCAIVSFTNEYTISVIFESVDKMKEAAALLAEKGFAEISSKNSMKFIQKNYLLDETMFSNLDEVEGYETMRPFDVVDKYAKDNEDDYFTTPTKMTVEQFIGHCIGSDVLKRFVFPDPSQLIFLSHSDE